MSRDFRDRSDEGGAASTPPSRLLRLPGGSGGFLGRFGTWIVLGFWGLVLFLLVWTIFYTVPADSAGIVQRFGRYVRTDDPGLRFKAPFGIDSVRLVPVRRQLKLEFGFATPGASNPFQ